MQAVIAAPKVDVVRDRRNGFAGSDFRLDADCDSGREAWLV
jgi:hypothetical protein